MSVDNPKKIEPGTAWLNEQWWSEYERSRFVEAGVNPEVYLEFSRSMRKIVWDWQEERLEGATVNTEKAQKKTEKIQSLDAQIVSTLRDFLSRHRDFSAETLRSIFRELAGRYYLERSLWLGTTESKRRTKTDEDKLVDIALQFYIEASRDAKK